jgi:hypothetical protein
VLARMLGYPTRVSVGFLPGETSIERPDHFVVRGNDAHAWPEVYFNEAGWVTFEPTPRGAAPPPAYTQRQTPASGVNPPDLDPGAARGRRNGQGPRGFQDPDIRPGRARVSRDRPVEPDVWHDSFLRLAALFGGIAILFLLGTPLMKFALNRRRYLRAKGPDGVAGAAFEEFEQEASDLASQRLRSESPKAFVRRLISLQRIPTRPALRLVELFEAATYGSAALTEVQGREAVRLTHALRRELWSDASWAERAGRLFSPGVVLAELRTSGRQPGDAPESPRVGRARGWIRPAARQR